MNYLPYGTHLLVSIHQHQEPITVSVSIFLQTAQEVIFYLRIILSGTVTKLVKTVNSIIFFFFFFLREPASVSWGKKQREMERQDPKHGA